MSQDDDKRDKPRIDPSKNPRLAAALEKLQSGLKEGEDPLFYDWRDRKAEQRKRKKRRAGVIIAGSVDEARVYLPPTTLPPEFAHKTLEMQTVRVAEELLDPRKAATQPRLTAPGPEAQGSLELTEEEEEITDRYMSPVPEENASPLASEAPVSVPSIPTHRRGSIALLATILLAIPVLILAVLFRTPARHPSEGVQPTAQVGAGNSTPAPGPDMRPREPQAVQEASSDAPPAPPAMDSPTDTTPASPMPNQPKRSRKSDSPTRSQGEPPNSPPPTTATEIF